MGAPSQDARSGHGRLVGFRELEAREAAVAPGHGTHTDGRTKEGKGFIAHADEDSPVILTRMLMLHLVRHGETAQAAEGYLAGDIDPPLTDKGLMQARALARYAATLSLTAVYVSPKLRARQTAQPLLESGLLAAFEDPGLREISYGSWEGKKESSLKTEQPEAFTAWTQDPALVSPPGGESAFAIAARALPVLVRARQEHPKGNVLFVSHKATIRIMVCALLGVPLGRFRDRVACPPASLTTFEFGERGAMLTRLADVHYLAAG